MAVAKAQQQIELRRNEEKWSRTLMDAGWTALPSVILEKQQALALDPLDLNILLQLARHWWFNDNKPHPAKGTIAQCIGVDPSTVRRRIARLEKDGLIQRVYRHDNVSGRQETNTYHFDGLIKAATPLAEEAIAKRAKRRTEDAARRTRKRPRLVVVE